MKKVVSNAQVAKLWASQKQWTAKNAQGSFYYRDSTIYSYGPHFPIARWINNTVYFTTRSYSKTTAKHKDLVKRVIPTGVPVQYVNSIP